MNFKVLGNWIQKIVFSLLALLALIIIGYYYTTDITKEGSFLPPCIFKTFTGLSCMACGSQRAVHHLLTGEWLKALSNNALLVLSIPGVLFYGFRRMQKDKNIDEKPSAFIPWSVMKWFLIALLFFMVIRNLPFLAPYLSA